MRNFELLTLSPDLGSFGRPALIFTKKIGDKYVTVQRYSGGKKALSFDTIWINKGQTPPVTAHASNNASPLLTSETHAGTVSTSGSIPNTAANVKPITTLNCRGL
jgi:hypothetical protein